MQAYVLQSVGSAAKVLSGHRLITIAIAIIALIASSLQSVGADELVRISPRSGITTQILISAVPNAKAVVVLLPGGHGRLKIKNGRVHKLTGNYLVARRALFNTHGLTTALLDAPSDRQDRSGLTSKYRMTVQHARDITVAIAYLRKKFSLPVWLVGTSRGSTSAAGVATRFTDKGPDGLVLSSSIGIAHHKGGNLLDFKLSRITVPTLVIHHERDRCHVTPFAGARRIYKALTSAKPRRLVAIRGGHTGPKTCSGSGHHGFAGVQANAVQIISDWIKAN